MVAVSLKKFFQAEDGIRDRLLSRGLGDVYKRQVLAWIKESDELSDVSFCDAGCGVGSLSLPLAAMGADSISASDISEAMAQEAERRAREAGLDMAKLNFFASDLESLSGSFHTVCCLDVFIHYPQQPAEEMVKHLCSLTEERLIVSFAPYTLSLIHI